MSRFHKRRPIAAALITAVSISAALFADATPATAASDAPVIMAEEPAQGFAACPDGSVCIWKDAWFATNDYRLNFVSFSRYISDYRGFNYRNTNINSANTATSIVNDGRSEDAYMYANANKKNLLFHLPRGNFNLSLAGNHGDNIESGYFKSHN